MTRCDPERTKRPVTGETLNISILIATANRPDQLAITLGGLARCRLPDADIEVVVAESQWATRPISAGNSKQWENR